mgnify:CR=1 FL=1
MNNARRKQIKKASELLMEAKDKVEEARGILEDCKGEEEEYKENMPESLQDSEKAQVADTAIEKPRYG